MFTLQRAKPEMERITICKGLFDATVASFEAEPIAMLRLDGDWYESTLVCLENLWPHVVADGLVIIDDYYTWDGCARAVHDYLSRIRATSRIRMSRIASVCYIVKSAGD